MSTIVILGRYAWDSIKPASTEAEDIRRMQMLQVSGAIMLIITTALCSLALYSLAYGKPWSHKTAITILAAVLGDTCIAGAFSTIDGLHYAFVRMPRQLVESNREESREELLNPERGDELP